MHEFFIQYLSLFASFICLKVRTKHLSYQAVHHDHIEERVSLLPSGRGMQSYYTVITCFFWVGFRSEQKSLCDPIRLVFPSLLFALTDTSSESGPTTPPGSDGGPQPEGILLWVFIACAILLLIIVVSLVVLWRFRHRRRRRIPESQPSASVPLNTLAAPKRDSISSDNNGSDRSDVVFPLRPSDSMLCRHYERVSCDYGPPVYIVQEITPQSPTNVYYKV